MLVSLHHFLVTHIHCLCSGADQPMSPFTAALGAYLPTPRKYRHARFWTALMHDTDWVPHNGAL